MSQHPETELLTTLQAARRLGVSKSWLAKRRLTGEGPPYVKLSRSVRYRALDLDSYVTEKIRTSTSQAA